MDRWLLVHASTYRSLILTPNEHGFEPNFSDLNPEIKDSNPQLTDSQLAEEWEDFTSEFLMNLACVPDFEAPASVQELTLAFKAYLRSSCVRPCPGGYDFVNEMSVEKERGLAGAFHGSAVGFEASPIARERWSLSSTDSLIGSMAALLVSSMAAPLVSSDWVNNNWSDTLGDLQLWVDGIKIRRILLPPKKRFKAATSGH